MGVPIGALQLAACALLSPLQQTPPRTPVLLVPGWHDPASRLGTLRSRLLADGWAAAAVSIVDFEDPTGSNIAHARTVAAAVDDLRAATGAARVDVVAHSMGGLAVRYYLRRLGGESAVRRVIFLGTPHGGTLAAYMAWGQGAREMRFGSRFLRELNGGLDVPPGVEATTIRTPLELRVLPHANAVLDGARDVTVCCPTHPGLVRHARTFALIRRVLLDERATRP